MRIQDKIKIATVPVILAIVVKSINVFSYFCANLIYPKVSFLDTENAFSVLCIHHVVQAAIAILLLLAYARLRNISLIGFGIKTEGFSNSLKYVVIFLISWAFIQIAASIILVKAFNQSISFPFSINVINLLGYLSFQLFLSGPSEELLFRVIVIGVLSDLLKKLFERAKLNFYLISVSTLIFIFDHINFKLIPFSITHLNILQLLTVLIPGSFLGWLFIRYKNYWSVALAHSSLNVVIVLSSLVLKNLL